MKIITILGSPRKKGNTTTVLSMFEDKVEKNLKLKTVENLDVIGNAGRLNEHLHGSVILDAW